VPSAKTLYERACNADPHPEAFQAWLSWARKHATWQEADQAAPSAGEKPGPRIFSPCFI